MLMSTNASRFEKRLNPVNGFPKEVEYFNQVMRKTRTQGFDMKPM